MDKSTQSNSHSGNSELNIPIMEWKREKDEILISLSGYWRLSCRERPRIIKRWQSLVKQSSDVRVFHISCTDSADWDSSLVVFFKNAINDIRSKKKTVEFGYVPAG